MNEIDDESSIISHRQPGWQEGFNAGLKQGRREVRYVWSAVHENARRVVRNLRSRADNCHPHHSHEWACGVRFAANQIEGSMPVDDHAQDTSAVVPHESAIGDTQTATTGG